MTITLLAPPADRPEIVDDLTRRELIAGALAAGLVTAAGCGRDRSAEDGPSAAGEGFPVTIEHLHGSTTISALPQRVVTLGLIEQDPPLALGVVPVGTTEWLGEHTGAIQPWARSALGTAPVPEVMSLEAIQFEQIATLRPDLIIAIYNVTVERPDYERLSAIAPTVLRPAGTDVASVGWQDLTRIVGRAVGKAGMAEQLVEQVEGRFAAARAAHPEFATSTAMNAYPSPDGIYQAYPPPDLGGQFLAGLGFRTPPAIEDLAAGKSSVDLSSEQLELLDADVIVWLLDDGAHREQLLANPLYRGTRSVTEGRAVYLPYDDNEPPIAAAMSIQTVLSLPFLIDALVPRLAAALDGDPATEVPE